MKQEIINLNGLAMNAVETDSNGVVGIETIFDFKQVGKCVSAEYAGGSIQLGFLVGLFTDTELIFRFCQLVSDGKLNGGESRCRVEIGTSGLVRIIENFAWESRPGGGPNVIQEIR